MIDPRTVTNFERTPRELQEFLLFAVVVAGKGAFQQAKKLEEFLSLVPEDVSPFAKISIMCHEGTLDANLRSVKMGQYNRIGTAFRGLAYFFGGDTCNPLSFTEVEYLQCIKGIGMKTARFFVMHTRPHQQYACLDTHILRWLAEKGHIVPKSTPQGDKYTALEKIFLAYCQEAGKLPADMDLQIWNEAHKKVEMPS